MLIRFVSIYQTGCIISMLCFMGTKDLVPSDECGSTRKSKVLNLTSVSCKQSVYRNLYFHIPSHSNVIITFQTMRCPLL